MRLAGLAVVSIAAAAFSGSAAPAPSQQQTSRVELTMNWGPSSAPDLGTIDGLVDYRLHRSEERFRSADDEAFVGWRSVGRIVGETSYVGWTRGGEMCWLSNTSPEPVNPLEFIVLARTSPQTLAQALKARASSVEPLGEESIRGVLTDGFRFRLDQAELGGVWADYFRDESPEALVLEGWVDANGTVRRVDFGSPTDELSPSRLEFFDFGTPVQIEPPKDLLGNVGGCATPGTE